VLVRRFALSVVGDIVGYRCAEPVMFVVVAKVAKFLAVGPKAGPRFFGSASTVTEVGTVVRAFCAPWHRHASADQAAACARATAERLAAISENMTA